MPRIAAKALESSSVEAEIARLRGLGVQALRARWRISFGQDAPTHLARHLLFAMLAYRLQAEAGVVLLNRGEVFYILEVVRGRFRFDLLKRKVMELKQRYGSSILVIEDSPISRGLIQSLREKSINVTVYKPETDKRARVIAQSDLFAGGSVRFPRRAAWLEDFTAELLAFPGRHDDQVDALTQGLAWGREKHGEFSCGFVKGLF